MATDESWRGDLERLRRAQTARGRAQGGAFTIEGFRLHERALRAGRRIELALVGEAVCASAAQRPRALLAALREAGTRQVVVPDDVMRAETAGRDLGAILGLLPSLPRPCLRELVEAADEPLFLAAVDIREPGNVGALARTAHAAGASAFITSGASDAFHPKTLRTSMGSLLKLPVMEYEDTAEMLEALHGCGIETVGMAAGGGVLLPQATFARHGVAVLVGNEAWGLSGAVQAAVDQLVTIPMAPGVDSYSVNAAAAIVLYEVRRAALAAQARTIHKDEGNGGV